MMDECADKTAMPSDNKIEKMNALRKASSQSCWAFPRNCTATNWVEKFAQTAQPIVAQQTIATRPNGSVMNRKKTRQASVQSGDFASRPRCARGKQPFFVVCNNTDHHETFGTLKATRGLMRLASICLTKNTAHAEKFVSRQTHPKHDLSVILYPLQLTTKPKSSDQKGH
jgi:hypothetical protein